MCTGVLVYAILLGLGEVSYDGIRYQVGIILCSPLLAASRFFQFLGLRFFFGDLCLGAVLSNDERPHRADFSCTSRRADRAAGLTRPLSVSACA